MSKEIDQLDLSTAKEIDKWLIPSVSKENNGVSDNVLKTRVRTYLKVNKLTPYDALEKIRKQNSSLPKRVF
jgi:hypothetical protein